MVKVNTTLSIDSDIKEEAFKILNNKDIHPSHFVEEKLQELILEHEKLNIKEDKNGR